MLSKQLPELIKNDMLKMLLNEVEEERKKHGGEVKDAR
jgi:hypothetical protein